FFFLLFFTAPPPPEIYTLSLHDALPICVELNAWIIKPKGFDPSHRYPLLMNVYGGPGSQTVTDSWGGANYLWHQMLARDGYLVRSEEHTSELQSLAYLVCRLLLEKKKKK